MWTQEKGNFTERAVNKFIELVLSRIVDAERLQVRIKSNLKKLSRGELDALVIQMSNFRLRRNLQVAEFQFDIGASAVNTKSIIHRKIELLYPAEGTLRITLTQDQLTVALNAELANLTNKKTSELQFQEVICELQADSEIAFHFQWTDAEGIKTRTYFTIPYVDRNHNAVLLRKQERADREPPTEFVEQAIAQTSHILSLNDLANQGTSFNIQKIDIIAGQIAVQASAKIDQFPSA